MTSRSLRFSYGFARLVRDVSTLPRIGIRVIVRSVATLDATVCTVPSQGYADRVSTADSMAKVISTLDWGGDLGPASLPVVEAEQLRSRLGDGAARWVAGAAEQSLAALHGQIHDSLAPWPIIRTFAQHVLTVTLLRLAGGESPPADTEAIDRDLAEDIVARDIPLPEITQRCGACSMSGCRF